MILIGFVLAYYFPFLRIAICSDPTESNSNHDKESIIIDPEKVEKLQPVEPTKAADYLPGGQQYREMVGSETTENPRKDKPVPKWIHDWEQTWRGTTQ